jgi:hypothetical protein
MTTKFDKMFLMTVMLAILMLPKLQYGQSGIDPYKISRVGQSGWQFLKVNGDPRQSALGGSMMTTIQPGASVIFGSPAILTMVKGANVQFNTQNWIADIKHHSFAYSQQIRQIGTFALSVVVMDYGDIPETIHLPLQGGGTVPFITGETFSARDMAIGLSYAKQITAQLSMGGTFRYLNETIAGVGMSNWSADFSTFYYTGFRSLRMSLSARNFGPDAHLVGYSEELQSEPVDIRMPLELRAGVAYDLLEGKISPHLLTLILEGKVSSDGPEKIHLGTEYLFKEMLAVRAGYRFNYDEEGLTLGAGLNFPIGAQRYSLNYAFLDFGDLQQVQSLSLGWTIIRE